MGAARQSPPAEDRVAERHRMVEAQIAGRGICHAGVLAAMRGLAREAFVAPEVAAFAYADTPLGIAAGQTISQPYIVARMIEAAGVGPGDRVLEVGAGSGYAAAVLSRIGAEVFAIERHAVLAEAARTRLAALGYGTVALRTGDGCLGWPEAAPFDAILVSAAGPAVPEALKSQLAPGGRLVMPVGGAGRAQTLIALTRRGAAAYDRTDLGLVSFVPLVTGAGPA